MSETGSIFNIVTDEIYLSLHVRKEFSISLEMCIECVACRIFNTLFSTYALPSAGAVFLILYFTKNKSMLQSRGYIEESACRGGLLGVFPYE